MIGPVAIHAYPSSRLSAGLLAQRLGVPIFDIDVHRFPDGELLVTATPGARTSILYISLDRPNDKLIAILLACDALRRQGTERIVLVAPYLCYMRQDAVFHQGEAVSQQAIGRLLASCVDRVVTVEAHLHRTRSIDAVLPGISTSNLSAMPAIADALIGPNLDRRTVIVGPDAESRAWVSELAGQLGLDHAVGQKQRLGDRSVKITLADTDAVARRPIVLVDDVVSSGGTLMTCAKTLLAAGAQSVDALIVHALFPKKLLTGFASSGIRSIRSTDSVSHPTNTITLAGTLAAALREEISTAEATQ